MAVTVENGACTGWGVHGMGLQVVLVSRDALETRRRSDVHSVYGLMHAVSFKTPSFSKPQDNVMRVNISAYEYGGSQFQNPEVFPSHKTMFSP